MRVNIPCWAQNMTEMQVPNTFAIRAANCRASYEILLQLATEHNNLTDYRRPARHTAHIFGTIRNILLKRMHYKSMQNIVSFFVILSRDIYDYIMTIFYLWQHENEAIKK